MPLDIITVDDLAKLLGCAPDTVRERTRQGALPGLKFGDDWVFPVAALNQRLSELALEEASKRRAGQGDAAPKAKARRRPPTLPST